MMFTVVMSVTYIWLDGIVFINNVSFWINEVKKIQDKKDEYDIHVNVTD